MPIERDDDDTTRAVARLPELDIAIEHRRSEHAEQISIHLQAMRPFGASAIFSMPPIPSRSGRTPRN